MREKEASYTAEGSAFARAVGAQHPDPKLRNPDWLAHWMLGPTFRRRALPGVSRISVRVMELLVPGSFFVHQARTQHFDGLVRAAVRDGAKQVVLLGAGFDTRAYRLADLLAKVTVFEVDHPAMSAVKREMVARSIGVPPANVHYLAVDFARQRTADRLADAGFDRAAASFVLWEGVSMYLDRSALDATLELAAQSGEGSLVAFDYMFEDAIEHPEKWAGAQRTARAVKKSGERFTFGIEPSRVGAIVAERGLDLLENLMPAEVEARYLIGSDGALWGHVPSYYAIASARRR